METLLRLLLEPVAFISEWVVRSTYDLLASIDKTSPITLQLNQTQSFPDWLSAAPKGGR